MVYHKKNFPGMVILLTDYDHDHILEEAKFFGIAPDEFIRIMIRDGIAERRAGNRKNRSLRSPCRPDGVPRDHRVYFRVSDSERHALARISESAGVSVSEFIRKMILRTNNNNVRDCSLGE